LRILKFHHDVSEFLRAQTAAEFPAAPQERPSYIVAFGRTENRRPDPVLVDDMTARILELSDGTRTVAEIVRALDQSCVSAVDDIIKWIEHIFVVGFVRIQEARINPIAGTLPDDLDAPGETPTKLAPVEQSSAAQPKSSAKK
jgi:hypothetical protein